MPLQHSPPWLPIEMVAEDGGSSKGLLKIMAPCGRDFLGRATSPIEVDGLTLVVIIAVIALVFVANRPADLTALSITMVAATRLPILPTVSIGIAAAGGLRHLPGRGGVLTGDRWP